MSQTERDPLDLLGLVRDEAEDAEARRLRRLVEQSDVKWLMSAPEGRRFAWRLLEIAGVFRNPFVGGPQTDFNCGLMAMGQTVLAEINAVCPERYHEMVREQQTHGRPREPESSPAG